MNATPSKSSPARALLVAAGVVVALVAVAWIALAVLLPPARVKALVESQMKTALRREARFEGASVGLFPPVRLTVRKFELAEPGASRKARRSRRARSIWTSTSSRCSAGR